MFIQINFLKKIKIIIMEKNHINNNIKINKNNLLYIENELESETNKLHSYRLNYITKQKVLDEKKRIILLDWMMEVCSQLGFKRRTYYSSIVLVDLFFANYNNQLQTSQLQLVGVCCLFLSAKNEEIKIPNVHFFALACANAYTIGEILSFERVILNELNWKIQFPNLSDWANYIMTKWDNFVLDNINLPKFRKDKKYGNQLFINFFLILDVISLDYYSLFIQEKGICVSLVFLLIGISMDYFSFNDVSNLFNNCNNVSKVVVFRQFFDSIFESEFKINKNEVSYYINYVCMFFKMNFQYEKPNMEALTIEEELQFQTHNSYNIESINKILEYRNNKQ